MKKTASSSNDQKVQPNRGDANQRQVRFIEEGVKMQYSNVFNIGFGTEEVVFMFANPSIDPNVMRIESKIAVSVKTAKRMAAALGNLIQRYEAINGVLDISAPRASDEGSERKNQ